MLELFLFINPISERARRAEAAVNQVVCEASCKTAVHFVPLVNFHVIDQYMTEAGLNPKNLVLRNRLFATAYALALDYKAAQFQGNVKARALLLAEQDLLAKNAGEYWTNLPLIAAERVGLDVAALTAERSRPDLRDCLGSDHRIAQEMGVTDVPSAVLFNTTDPGNTAVRLAPFPQETVFKRVFHAIRANRRYDQPRELRVL